MTEANHSEYYRARAEHSRTMAQAARDPHIAKIHIDFARRYEDAAATMIAESRVTR